MAATTEVRMSQEDLLKGLQVFHKPHRQAKYLACALLNGAANVEDVAHVAFKTSIEHTSAGKISLVLPTFFQLKKIAKSDQKEVVKGFFEEVNKTLGPDHQRLLINSKCIKSFKGAEGMDFLSDGVSSRDEKTEKVYFFANALIANLKVGWKSNWDPNDKIFKVHLHCDDFQSWIIMTAYLNKDRVDLSFQLQSFLKGVTGKNKAISGDYKAIFERISAVKITSEAPRPPTDDICTIA